MFNRMKAAVRRRALICPNCNEEHYLDFLKNISDDICEEGIREIEIKTIEKRIAKEFNLDIEKRIRTNTDGRIYIHIGATLQHQFRLSSDLVNGRSRDEILDKLIVILYGDSSHTLSQAYDEWMKYRMSIEIDSKTLLENKNEWVTFIRDSSLAKKCLVEISAHDLNLFFDKLTANHNITSKRFVNVKSILKGIFTMYVDKGVLVSNPVLSTKPTASYSRRFKTAPPKNVYSEEDINAMVNYFHGKKDIYDKAAYLSMFMFVRISEFIALKYSDLEKNGIWIRRSTLRFREIDEDKHGRPKFGKITYRTEDRMKGNKETGYRWVPLTDEALELIEEVHAASPDDEFLFMFRGHQLRPDTFNHHLEKACNELGIPYLPSHQIRFANATRLHKAGVPIEELSIMMGHSDIATTIRYLRRNEATKETIELTRNTLSFTSKSSEKCL